MTMAVDLPVAVPSLVGSLLSVIGTAFILVAYYTLPPERSHIRHPLIFNLAVAGVWSP